MLTALEQARGKGRADVLLTHLTPFLILETFAETLDDTLKVCTFFDAEMAENHGNTMVDGNHGMFSGIRPILSEGGTHGNEKLILQGESPNPHCELIVFRSQDLYYRVYVPKRHVNICRKNGCARKASTPVQGDIDITGLDNHLQRLLFVSRLPLQVLSDLTAISLIFKQRISKCFDQERAFGTVE